MSRTALIQIVSEQTMQNILPALAIKPEKLFHLTTEKVTHKSAHIVEALRQSGLKVQVENIPLSTVPTIPEVSKLVQVLDEEIRDSGATTVVNFTGGTKIMSIGAHQGACSAKIPSIYVDTEHGTFIDGNSGIALSELIGTDFSITRYQRQITVNTVAVANGCERATGGKDWKKYLEIAEFLLGNPEIEKNAWEGIMGANGLCPRGFTPRRAIEWLNLLDKKIKLPSELTRYIERSGLLDVSSSSVSLKDSYRHHLEELAQKFDPGRYFKLIPELSFPINFLSGGWWEVAVVAHADKSGCFRDIRWSADVGFRQKGTDMEEDVLALRGVNLAYFSCKRGGDKSKLSRLLEEVDASARRIGGAFAEKYIAIYTEPFGMQKTRLEQRAKQLNIKILTPSLLRNLSCFS